MANWLRKPKPTTAILPTADYSIYHALANMLHGVSTVNGMLKTVRNYVEDELQVDRVSLLFYDENTGNFFSADRAPGEPPTPPHPVGHSITGQALLERRPIVIQDCSNTDLIPHQFVQELQLRAVAAIPLVSSTEDPIGVLRLDYTHPGKQFNQAHMENFHLIGLLLGLKIEAIRWSEVAHSELNTSPADVDEFYKRMASPVIIVEKNRVRAANPAGTEWLSPIQDGVPLESLVERAIPDQRLIFEENLRIGNSTAVAILTEEGGSQYQFINLLQSNPTIEATAWLALHAEAFKTSETRDLRQKTMEQLAQVIGMQAQCAALEEELSASNADIRAARQQLVQAQSLLAKCNREIEALARMSEELHACETETEVFAVARHALKVLLPDCFGATYLGAPGSAELVLVLTWSDGDYEWPDTMATQSCWALRKGKSFLSQSNGGLHCPHHNLPPHSQALCVPLIHGNQSLGLVIVVNSDSDAEELLTHSEETIQSITDQVGLTLTNINLRTHLENQSIRDPLTGLLNRRTLQAHLVDYVQASIDNDIPVALLLIELDDFGPFESLHGEGSGLALLHEFTRMVTSRSLQGESAYRYGFEQFVLLLPGLDEEKACDRADDLRETMTTMNVVHGGIPVGSVTVSIGIAIAPLDAASGPELLAKGEHALQKARAAGRNCVVSSAKDDV